MALPEKNLIAHLGEFRAPNHRKKYRFQLKNGSFDHLDDWEKNPNRICVWHYIVDEILVARHYTYDLEDLSPYFYVEDQSKRTCIIARIYDTTLDPKDGYISVGQMNPNEDARDHLCVIREGNSFHHMDRLPKKLTPSATVDTTPRTYKYSISGEDEANEVRFKFKIEGENRFNPNELWMPIWYFYKDHQLFKVSLEETPVIEWPEVRAAYDAVLESAQNDMCDIQNNEDFAQKLEEGLNKMFKNLQKDGTFVFMRFYKKDLNNEGDIGKPSPPPPPPPPDGDE